jgi:predicted esterase
MRGYTQGRMKPIVSMAALALLSLVSTKALAEQQEAPAWCAPESETLTDGMCYFDPSASGGDQGGSGTDTLVVFLHSLVRTNSAWQYEQQRLMMRTAAALQFAVLMPRGRPGIGPGRAPNVLAWPGSPQMQDAIEDEIIAEWDNARARIEERQGRAFRRVFVFGFSNGAYYTTTLAVRDRYRADGYGIFAGGNGSRYNRLLASRTERRAPIFVGYGTKDPARAHMGSLARMLADLHWQHRVKTAPIGHWVSDAQLLAAVRFLRGESSTTGGERSQ